jgi:hypothetical protein
MLKRAAVVTALLYWSSQLAHAQAPSQCSGSSKLGCLISDVYGSTGLTLPNPTHFAHFNSDFQANFSPLSAAIATELTLLPLASPASGFTYSFDRASGVYSRSAQSFGPILAERAETIGRRKFFTGITYQYFSFDSLDGIDLNHVPAVFTHQAGTGPGGAPAVYESDFLTTANSLNLFVSQMTGFATVGLTNRFDVSIAVPVLNVNVGVSSAVTIHRTQPDSATPPVQPHYFNCVSIQDSACIKANVSHTFSDSGHATGIGDVTLRFKGTVLRGERASVALATDLRLPSGDEKNYLGSGTTGVKPFVVASTTVGRVAPHLNIGYQINGNSLLAGDILKGTKGHLPNNLFYTVGADVGVSRQVTLAFDLLGQRVFGAKRVFLDRPFTSSVPEMPTPGTNVTVQSSYPGIAIRTGSFNVIRGSAGLKAQLGANLLLTVNLLFQMNNAGLRAKAVPLAGLSYTF